MSTKLSLLSRAAAVAGILALALPAFAQTTPPAQPSAPAPSAAAPATGKAISGDVPHKGAKTHAVKKSTAKTAKLDAQHKQTAEKPAAKKMDPATPAAGNK